MKKNGNSSSSASRYPTRNIALALAIGCLTLIVSVEFWSSMRDRKEVAEQIKAEDKTIVQPHEVEAKAVELQTPAASQATEEAQADKGIVWADGPRADVVEEFKPERKLIEHETLGELVELTYPGDIKRYEFPAAGAEQHPE